MHFYIVTFIWVSLMCAMMWFLWIIYYIIYYKTLAFTNALHDYYQCNVAMVLVYLMAMLLNANAHYLSHLNSSSVD